MEEEVSLLSHINLQLLLLERAYGLPSFLLATVVLFYCWGPRDLDADIAAIATATDRDGRVAVQCERVRCGRARRQHFGGKQRDVLVAPRREIVGGEIQRVGDDGIFDNLSKPLLKLKAMEL